MSHQVESGDDARARSDERLRALAETMRAFAEATADYATLLETVVQRVTRDLGDACAVMLLSDDGARVIPAALASRDEAVTQGLRGQFSETTFDLNDVGIVSNVIRTREPLLIPRIEPEDFAKRVAPRFVELALRVGVRAVISVPLEVHGGCIGHIALYRYRPESPPFDESDLAFARSLADHAALAIANARLLESLRRELKERRRAEEEAKTFVALVEHGDALIAMASFDGRLLFINRAGRKLLGVEPDQEVLGSLSHDPISTPEGGLARINR